jgi:integrase
MEKSESIKQAYIMLQMASTGAPLSARTVAGYIRIVSRILRRAGPNADIDDLIALSKQTKSACTWFSRRAALMYVFRQYVIKWLAEQDRMHQANEAAQAAGASPSWESWQKAVKRIAQITAWHTRLRDEPGIPIENRRPRYSKRRDLRGLPDDWQERIVARMPDYRLAALTNAVTGCRPDELVTGVELAIEDDMLVVTIKGSKVTARTGQPWRRLSWRLDSEWPLVRSLILAVQAGAFLVKIKCAKAYSSAMRTAGRREWPGRKATVTPYCFRHAFASNMKALGMEALDIAAALGHCSDIAKKFYGSANQGRSKTAVPVKLEAARKVKVKVIVKNKFIPSLTDIERLSEPA